MRTNIVCFAAPLVMMGVMMAAQASENNTLPMESRSLSSIIDVNNKGDVISFIKSYPASKIEPGLSTATQHILPDTPLEKWLTSVMVDATLKWEGGDCAAYDSDSDDSSEHCVSYLVAANTPKERCPSVELRFIVNQDATVYLMYVGSEVNDFGGRGGLEQLADLEKVLSDVKAKTVPNRPSNSSLDRLRARKGTDIAMYAAGLDVSRFDPSLPSERFDRWLERTAGWSFNWMSYPAFFHHCSFTPLSVYVRPVYAEGQSPPVYVSMDLGTWEEEIKGEPKLHLYYTGDTGDKFDPVKNLSALNNIIDAWKTTPKYIAKKTTTPKPPKPTYKPTAPVVQNMTPLGFFSRTRSTPTWHCYGHTLGLWKYGKRVFGTHYDLDGQCADSRAPTYIIRDVNFDPQTGKLEFWSYGTPGYKFVGKLDQDMVTGNFLGMFDEEVKLKRSKERNEPIPDSDKNVEAWCKVYAPNIRYVVEKELEELCNSLGVK